MGAFSIYYLISCLFFESLHKNEKHWCLPLAYKKLVEKIRMLEKQPITKTELLIEAKADCPDVDWQSLIDEYKSHNGNTQSFRTDLVQAICTRKYKIGRPSGL